MGFMDDYGQRKKNGKEIIGPTANILMWPSSFYCVNHRDPDGCATAQAVSRRML